MEEGTINMLHRRRPKANGTIIVPRMSHPQRAPSGQDVDQQAFAAVRSFPTTAYSPNLAQGQGLYVSNLESNRFTYQRQVSDAGDASLQALWLLFLKLQPSLCSLLGNLADWHGPQEELVRTDIVEEPSPTEHSANETQIQRQSNERESRFRYLDLCVPLYQAALKGDWLAAEALLQKYPDVVRDPITEGHMTALHIAAAAKRTNFVKELVKCMSADDLALQNKDGNTALCFAAASGIVTIAEEMVNMNNRLPCIRDSQGLTPLLIAASLGRRNMVSYLLSATPFDQLTAIERIQLLLATISTDMYDLALKILKMDRTLATAQDGNRKTALHELAKKPFAIGSKSELSIWETCLNSCFKGFYNKALMQTFAHQLVEDLWKEVRIVPDRDFSNLVDNHASFLFDAAEVGNSEFLMILVRSYPDLMWKQETTPNGVRSYDFLWA
ncbi:uncharacterized protein LOC132169454 [Corylus avellana]|uniref:uncharacterized protein LOC132169454 n=1 Tax=Corylus avellana TaxID=13451 RepID=UPI00286CA61B|nr:uncharacterized protein LOC132169454 [Corylus avellana]